jgi:hypothetical protein
MGAGLDRMGAALDRPAVESACDWLDDSSTDESRGSKILDI